MTVLAMSQGELCKFRVEDAAKLLARPSAEIDRRGLGGSKLKPGSRLSKAELQARGTWEFVKSD